MSSTPECVTKTPEIEAREAVNINQKPIENNAKSSFADYRNKLNNLDAYPTKIPLEIGNLLAELRKAKANEVQ